MCVYALILCNRFQLPPISSPLSHSMRVYLESKYQSLFQFVMAGSRKETHTLTMASAANVELHIIFLPYMAPGHMVPLVDIARLFARRKNLRVTIITTPMNAERFQAVIEKDTRSGHQIALKIVPFPKTGTGLPEGCENLIDTTTPEMTIKLIHAIELLYPKMEETILQLQPDCIVSDFLFYWTSDLAIKLGIPRLAFSGSSTFNLSIAYSLETLQPHKSIESETEPFTVPGLPDKIVLTKSQIPDILKARNKFSALFDKLKEAEKKSFGILVNSFYELEGAYADYYKKVVGINIWQIGPVTLFNNDEDDKAERGEKASASISMKSFQGWLDSKKPKSVLYVCLGSLTRFSKAQLKEIADALESMTHSFIWVLGKVIEAEKDEEVDREYWMPKEFEQRINESKKGMIVKCWAPQVSILEHQAIGGFMTHCGWNSILEGIAAGIPMITWPIFAEQFYNEKLVTQVLKFGIPIGNQTWKAWATGEMELIGREQIEQAVRNIMDDVRDAEDRRKTAMQLREMAKRAVEDGGSSSNDLKILIEQIRKFVRK